ncbi:MAG: ABC transporter permease subunit [Chloroflexi bacterium]|nr:MAG: ABC transporter permease subunit [Chloroflexota bacterium]
MRWTARDLRSFAIGLAYLAPSLVLFAVFVFIPLGRTFYLSLFNTRVTGQISTFNGIDHYLDLITSATFRNGLVATALFALYTVPVGIALGLVLAVLLNQRLRGINVFRTMMSPAIAIIAVSITTVWITLGTNIIVLLAGLQGIPEEIYEAARLDGARGVRMFTRITVPMVSPSLFFLLVVDTVAVLQAFTQIHLLTRGGPVDATRTLVYSFSSVSSSGWFITSERGREADCSRPDGRASRTSGASPVSASSLAASAVTIQRQRRPLPLRRAGSYVLLAVVSVLVAFPLLLALSYSFMSESEIATFPPPVLPLHPSLDNYEKVLAAIPIGRYLLNSFVVSSAVVIGQLITASLAAYAFSFLVFRGRQLLFFVFLSTLMIPWEATIIPNYMTVRSLGWLDTYQGLAVPFMATAFGTFLLRQAFLQIPREMWDAARIDGATTFRFLREVVIPLSRPALGTVAIYGFLSTYNQYFWPLLITNETLMRTTQVGIAQLRFEESLRWGLVMAGVIMVAVPTLALLVLGQRQLIRGLTAGAVKG